MSPPGSPDLALMESDGSGVLQPDVNPPVSGNGLTEEVIRMAAQGKGRYVHMIYQTLSPLLYGICLRYAPRREDAQDMLQESFIKIFSNLSRFRHEGSFEGWARRITVNTALEFLRKKSPYFEEIEKGRGVAGRDFIEESLQAGELMALLSQMPLGYRTVFNLYAIEGYSHAEIAAMLGISEGTSKSQLSRAKDWLRQKLIHIYPERFKNNLIENHEEDTD
ncbi:MAG: sigma-70 family RNA polymerase sigma factor [Flavobacteriales bacterium]|nr:sigma-70 family RNA polymerase sigma factor [Flavobacteriales bacterium]MDW8432807.1 sigma-70 family RNA polymerase sigma factor [Flavobacteriales bacterium]